MTLRSGQDEALKCVLKNGRSASAPSTLGKPSGQTCLRWGVSVASRLQLGTPTPIYSALALTFGGVFAVAMFVDRPPDDQFQPALCCHRPC